MAKGWVNVSNRVNVNKSFVVKEANESKYLRMD